MLGTSEGRPVNNRGAGSIAAARDRRWRIFAVAAALAVVTSLAFAASIDLHQWGDRGVTVIDDIGEAIAAAIAAFACILAARRKAGRLRLAWALIACSAASWTIGEVVWCVYEVGLNQAVPFPSAADAGFLASVPFAIAGILAFSTSARGTATGWRMWLDGLIIGVALVFVGWAMGLSVVLQGVRRVDDLIALAYPASDIVILTLLILLIRRASELQKGRMLLLLGGLAANAISDSAFAYLTATNNYTAVGSILDTGWVIGYLMIALAAIWPSGRTDAVSERAPIDLWQIALPWVAISMAVVVGLVRIAQGKPLDLFLSFDTALLGGLVMVSQIMLHRDSLLLIVKARTSESTLADVIAHTPAAVARIGNDLRILDTNPRFGPLLGIDDASPLGVSLTSYFSTAEGNRISDLLGALRSAQEESVESDSEASRPDGSSVWLHWSATAVTRPQGGIEYFVAIFEDTTARHSAEAAAARSLELLERLSQIKTAFLQTVSHEFKTALVGIQGFTELIQHAERLDLDEVRSYATDINRDAERLDHLVTEVLDLDRIETGRTILKLGAVDLNILVTEELHAARQKVDGISIADTLDPALPLIAGDVEKLARGVRTLFDNAIRYSPDGGRITVTTRRKDNDVELVVSDQGTGARTDFDRLLFDQADVYAGSPIRKIVGAGLGLGIVRQVAELHGGHLWVDRLEGQGSVFHLLIPALSPTNLRSGPAAEFMHAHLA